MTTRWMSSRPAAGGLLTAAAAAFLLTGCASHNDTAYCLERANNQVVDDSQCDDSGHNGAYFYGAGRSGYSRGSVLPAGPRAEVNDPGARESMGIARTGSVGSKGGFGTTAKGSSSSGGGFSSGSHGSSGG
jgi:hypothetical protein